MAGRHLARIDTAREFRVLALAEQLGLLDPFLARDASVKGEIGFGGLDVGLLPGADLVEVEDAVIVELLLVDRTDTLDAGQVIGLAAARRRQPVGDSASRRRGSLRRRGLGCRLGRRSRLRRRSGLLGRYRRQRGSLVCRGELSRVDLIGI